MVKYRGRLDIIADILNAAGAGAKKTKIMYIANLSHKLLEKYLDETLRISFIRINNEGYEVTEKGRAFLEKYSDFSDAYSRIERERQNMMFEKESLEKMCEPPRDDDPKPTAGRGIDANRSPRHSLS